MTPDERRIVAINEKIMIDRALSDDNYFQTHRSLFLQSYITPYEHGFTGTPAYTEEMNQRNEDLAFYHTPIVVLEGFASIEDAQKIRKRLGFFEIGSTFWGPEWLEKHIYSMAASLEDLDDDGVTEHDLRILGAIKRKDLRDDHPEIIPIPDRNLTGELYQTMKKLAEEYPEDPDATAHWEYTRDGKSYLEAETQSSPEME